jgi:formylglycine-generating enzyme required for sulfatase activity
VTAFYSSGSGESADRGISAVVSQAVVIEGGPFLEGLDDEIRAFILLTCQKVADDPEECDESKLLAGEFPQKTIDLPSFLIDSTEVTIGAFTDCVTEEACSDLDFKSCSVYTHQGLQVALRVPKLMLEPDMPASCVTREEARDYCAWKGGTLPTNSQWEKAARGAGGRLFPWGNSWNGAAVNWGELDIIKSHVVGKIDGYEWTSPVGAIAAGSTETGLYDMAGNVAEWVDGKDALIGHVRGGSWTSNPFEVRTTGRQEHRADVRRTDVGFRCVYPN